MAQDKIDKYAKPARAYMETAGTWHDMVTELTQHTGRPINTISDDHGKGTDIPVPMSVHSSLKRKCGLLQNTMVTE